MATHHSWYEFKASADGQKETTLFLYDTIGGYGKTAADFVNDLKAVPADNRLVLRIHSPGGSVLDGNAIFAALRQHPGGVVTHIDGLAASMASVIACAGDPVQMAENGLMMIHNVAGSMQGDSEDLRKMAETMDKIQQTVENIYAAKTGLPVEQIRQMMDDETWMTADEAQEMGFVDEITCNLAMAAEFDLSQFKNAPTPDELLRYARGVTHDFDAAVWTRKYIDSLPDSSFLYVETGGKKDGDGKTVPRSLRHFPYRDAAGKVDLPHLRNALARIPQSNLPADVKDRLSKKAQKILEEETKKTAGEVIFDIVRSSMAMFKKSATSEVSAEAQVSELESTISDLTAALGQANEARTTSEAAYASLKQTAEANQVALKTFSEWLGLEGEITKESLAKLIEDRAHARALEIAASQGAPPVPTAPAESAQSAEDLLAAYEAAPDKTKFLRANKKAIEKANAQLKASAKK